MPTFARALARLHRFTVMLLAASACTGLARAAEASPDYVLGEGDVLRIVVFQSPDLSIETRVSESGLITYPLLGGLKVGGLTVQAAERTIADGLRQGNYVRQPQVNMMVMQIRGNQVSALGMFNRPGRYPIDVTGMRLSEVVALAGGVSQGGAEVVTLSGSRDGQPYRVEVDLPALLTRGTGIDPPVRHGDVVFADRMPLVYVYGEVNRPGPVKLERGMNVLQALASGGGITLRGSDRGLRVHRRNAEGRSEVIETGMDDRLVDGDVLYVQESLF